MDEPVLVTSRHEMVVDRDHYQELVDVIKQFMAEGAKDPVALEDRARNVLDCAADPYPEEEDDEDDK